MTDQIDGHAPDDGPERITISMASEYEPDIDDFYEPVAPGPDLIRLETDCWAHIDLIRGAINRALRTWSGTPSDDIGSAYEYMQHDTGLLSNTLIVDGAAGYQGEFLIKLEPLTHEQTHLRAWAWGAPHRDLIPLIESQIKPYE